MMARRQREQPTGTWQTKAEILELANSGANLDAMLRPPTNVSRSRSSVGFESLLMAPDLQPRLIQMSGLTEPADQQRQRLISDANSVVLATASEQIGNGDTSTPTTGVSSQQSHSSAATINGGDHAWPYMQVVAPMITASSQSSEPNQRQQIQFLGTRDDATRQERDSNEFGYTATSNVVNEQCRIQGQQTIFGLARHLLGPTGLACRCEDQHRSLQIQPRLNANDNKSPLLLGFAINGHAAQQGRCNNANNNKYSSSLVSDESSDSNAAHCNTWSIQQADIGDGNCSTNQVDFIELLPSSIGISEGVSGDCFDISLLSKVLDSQPNSNVNAVVYNGQQQPGNDPLIDSQAVHHQAFGHPLLNQSLTTSLGCQSAKDQIGSSLLSINNINIPSDPESLQNNNINNCTGDYVVSITDDDNDANQDTLKLNDYIKQSSKASNGHQLTSILRSSNVNYHHSKNSGQDPHNVCQCNGNDSSTNL